MITPTSSALSAGTGHGSEMRITKGRKTKTRNKTRGFCFVFPFLGSPPFEGNREGEAPAEPLSNRFLSGSRLGRSLALPIIHNLKGEPFFRGFVVQIKLWIAWGGWQCAGGCVYCRQAQSKPFLLCPVPPMFHVEHWYATAQTPFWRRAAIGRERCSASPRAASRRGAISGTARGRQCPMSKDCSFCRADPSCSES
jgi:hypothetical protein